MSFKIFQILIFLGEYTLWWTNIAIEHGPVEIVDFPIKNGDFPLLFVGSPESTVTNHISVLRPQRMGSVHTMPSKELEAVPSPLHIRQVMSKMAMTQGPKWEDIRYFNGEYMVIIWLLYGYYMVIIWLLYGYYMINDG